MTMHRFGRSALLIAATVTLAACSSHFAETARTGMAANNDPATPAASTQFKVDRTMSVLGDGRWDYTNFDTLNNVLYVSRSTHTQVLKPANGSVIADVPDTKGVHGIALAPEYKRGFLTDGKANTVTVFDTTTYKRLFDIPVGEGPDSITYDTSTKRVYAMCGEGNCVSVIDLMAKPEHAVAATIDLGSGPEEGAWDGAGHLFVNLEDESKVAEIDLATMKVITKWALTGGENPSGIAIDRRHGLLFSGCRNAVMAVTDIKTGQTLQTLPIGHGVDGCGFDPGLDDAFASCGDGTLTVIHVDEARHCSVVQTVQTKQGARTMTLDPATHTLYLPTAEFQPKVEGERWPKMKDGTFQIVVVKPN